MSKPFEPPTFVPGLETNGPPFVCDLRLSPDLLIGYFSELPLHSTGIVQGMFTATRPRVGAPFGAPADLGDATINAGDDGEPTVSSDGLTLVFARGGYPSRRLLYGTRTSVNTPFGYVGTIPGIPDSAGPGGEAFLREDGRVLYFSAAPLGDNDIYRATRSGSGFSFSFNPPVPLTELNTPFDDGTPVVTPDDRTIYFGSTRPTDGGLNSHQIWTATRASASDPFSPPTIVAELSSVHPRWPTFISADGCALYFCSSDGSDPTNGPYVAEKPAQ